MNAGPRVAITGLGAVTGAGPSVDALMERLWAGAPAVRHLPALAPLHLDIGPMACTDPDGAALLAAADRTTALALAAADEAMGQAGLPGGGRLGVMLGTTLGSKTPWLAQIRERTAPPQDFGCGAPARALAARYQARAVHVLSCACVSGNAALGAGLDAIRDGTLDAVLCGGADALCDFVISGFAALKAHAPGACRPFDRDRAGLNLGEGAGFLVLEAEAHARRRGARVLAFLAGYGLSCDANHMTGPDREGRGAAAAMRAALRDAGAEQVDFVSLHGTGTRFNDLMEARALLALLGEKAAEVPVNSIKGAIGHTLGAAAALEAIMAVRALGEQRIPPTCGLLVQDPEIPLLVVRDRPLGRPLATVLSTASGFGGLNAAVVLTRGDP